MKELDYQLKVQKEVADEFNSQTNERNVLLNGIFDLYKQRTELEKENKRLQEQLKEANEIIKSFYWKDRGQASSYCKKWGVK